jgi:hypothetical protein
MSKEEKPIDCRNVEKSNEVFKVVEPSRSDVGQHLPDAFVIRFPAPLLQKVRTDESFLEIDKQSALLVTESDDHEHTLVVRTDEMASPSLQILQRLQEGLAFQRVAAISSRTTLSSSASRLGKRARERLEEELSKRREIIVLPSAANQGSRETAPELKATVIEGSSLLHGELQQLSSERASQVAKENSSSVVRIWGLPEDATPDLIRGFFRGLNPDRIVILPSLATTIGEWGEKKVESCRVLVKFLSSPQAHAATMRSNEYVIEKGEKIVLRVSLVLPRFAAKYILEHLAIDAKTGESLLTTLKQTEDVLSPGVIDLLWTFAIRRLRLQSAEGWLKKSPQSWKHPVSEFYCDLSKLPAHCQSLAQELERLESSISLASGHLGILTLDSRLRLHQAACRLLRREIEAATNLMLMSQYEKQRARSSDKQFTTRSTHRYGLVVPPDRLL